MTREKPCLYVACLHCYNSGRLHGHWLDVPTDPDELHAALVDEFHIDDDGFLPCGGEELAVHDHENLGRFGEDLDLERACAIASLLEQFPERPVLCVLDHTDGDTDRARLLLDEGYRGSWDSAANYAEEFCTDVLGELPTWAAPYLDYERLARDWELAGDILTLAAPEGQVHVFDGSL